VKKKESRLNKKCQLCENIVPMERSKYCSEECASKGKKSNVYWTYGIKIPNDAWWKKKRFIFK